MMAFDPITVLEVQAEKCTGLHGVPSTMFIAEPDHPRFAEFDCPRCALWHHGRLPPCPIEVMKRGCATCI